MAKNCYGRRLSELLQEQQEPFLFHGGGGGEGARRCSVAEACRRRLRGIRDHASVVGRRGAAAGGGGDAGRSALRRVLCGRAVRRALRWELAAGCFSCGAARESFRRLPRSGDCRVAVEFDEEEEDDDDGTGDGRQLSPVSVLELLSDKESPMLGDDDDKPSTSESSPPSDNDLAGAASPCFTFYDGGKICAMEVQGKGKKFTMGCKAMEDQQTIISSWERIAGDISKIPMLVELDLAGSKPERWRLGEEEMSLVGACIEAMIFEEIKGEAVLDMLV